MGCIGTGRPGQDGSTGARKTESFTQRGIVLVDSDLKQIKSGAELGVAVLSLPVSRSPSIGYSPALILQASI
jgi:hypothetical protein